jgi:hypothetical protein
MLKKMGIYRRKKIKEGEESVISIDELNTMV